LGDLLFGVLNLVLHLILVDLELDLTLILQLGKDHEGLIVVPVVDQSTYLVDRLVGFESLLHWVDTQSVVHLLLSTIRQFLKVLEVDDCRLHRVLSLLLLLLELHSHQLALHLHELLVWNHAELLILRIIATTLMTEHHLHIHIWVNVVHTLTWETHLVLHHHSWELIHILHTTIHSHWCWHLVVHAIAWTHLVITIWGSLRRSQFMVTMSITALVTEFAITTFFEMSTFNGLVIWTMSWVWDLTRLLLLHAALFR